MHLGYESIIRRTTLISGRSSSTLFSAHLRYHCTAWLTCSRIGEELAL